MTWAQHLTALERTRLTANGSISVRIMQVDSTSTRRAATRRIRDLFTLEKGAATDEEVLLRQRQLATGFRYGFSFGFSYASARCRIRRSTRGSADDADPHATRSRLLRGSSSPASSRAAAASARAARPLRKRRRRRRPAAPPPPLRVFLDCGQCDDGVSASDDRLHRLRARSDGRRPARARDDAEHRQRRHGVDDQVHRPRPVPGPTNARRRSRPPSTATSDDERKEFARVFRLGTRPALPPTRPSPVISISPTSRPLEAAAPSACPRSVAPLGVPVQRATANANGEQSTNSRSYSVSGSANRVTEALKINVYCQSSEEQERCSR